MLTPVGELHKDDTREYARRLGLVTADKRESVEICFVPDDDYVGLLERRLPRESPALSPGQFLTTSGEVVGSHRGYSRYTIGQRKGLPGGFDQPMYVVSIEPANKSVVIGTADDLYGTSVTLEEINWLAEPRGPGDSCELQIRYRSTPVRAEIQSSCEVSESTLVLKLMEPARAITPGQSGVIYDGDQLLGGGIIS